MVVKCFRCGKMLCTQQALNYHLTKAKKCNSPHTCQFCDKSFKSEVDLLYHKKECNMSYKKLAEILKPHDNATMFILDEFLNLIYTDNSERNDFLTSLSENSRIKFRQNYAYGFPKELFKLNDGTPVHISNFPKNELFVVIEQPYVHPLARKGFLTPQ